MSHPSPRRSRALIALALVGALGLAACGDDEETPAASGDDTSSASESDSEESTTTTTEADTEDREQVEVTGVEYAFQGLEGGVAARSELTFTNGGKEAHELVVMQRAAGETRPVEELVNLSEDELSLAVLFEGVAVAAPGEAGEVVDGNLVLDAKGEYIAICFIPVGTTELPEGPPEEGAEPSGPPHFTQGMVTEFTVS
jgi:TolA-binding protein